jgi:hypothetical protein
MDIQQQEWKELYNTSDNATNTSTQRSKALSKASRKKTEIFCFVMPVQFQLGNTRIIIYKIIAK